MTSVPSRSRSVAQAAGVRVDTAPNHGSFWNVRQVRGMELEERNHDVESEKNPGNGCHELLAEGFARASRIVPGEPEPGH